MIIRFSARNLGSVASARRSSSSSSGVAPRGVVPLIGLVSIVRSPSSSLVTSAYRSGDELSSHPRAPPSAGPTSCCRNPAYGAGLSSRSRRYAATGSRSLSASSR